MYVKQFEIFVFDMVNRHRRKNSTHQLEKLTLDTHPHRDIIFEHLNESNCGMHCKKINLQKLTFTICKGRGKSCSFSSEHTVTQT